MSIQLLDSQTIGKIAAGEVVERPSSVVKELIENAIDAGATRISVDIADGGSSLIRVSDDGTGIAAEDLGVAILRHATSKLHSFDDLEHLRTLGFRGEALPSIGAVSRLEIRSRAETARTGASIVVSHGIESEPRPGAVPAGTTVTVEDLFGNVPARRRFLRQPSTESSYISRLIGAYACHRSDIRWTLTIDGRKAISTPGNGDDHDAAIGVYGSELADEILLLRSSDSEIAVPGYTVSGWVSTPRVTRSHRQNLFFLVNGRLVQHRALTYALEEAYHSLLMVGRHPLGMVRIDLDPSEVDANVHPTKAEVKFVDERAACRAVQRTVHHALSQQAQDVLPQVTFAAPEPWGATLNQGQLPSWTPPAPLPPGRESQLAPEEPVSPPQGAAMTSGVPVMRVLGQVGGTYIIAEGPEGMFLIDQHAAHERVMYEKILGQMQTHAIDRQPLLDPLVVELSPEEMAAFESSAGELSQIGFDIEPFGNQSIAIRGIPAVSSGVDIGERIHLILQELAEGGAGQSWLDSVAISAACHTSIRAGQSLSLPEMRELVAQLERTQQPRACGHGRPTMLHMSQSDLERQFSRR
ncbi:MAG TPA: DNA mismatch repair endonuclease MutL [Thermomicrobiales bacterium]|nr:DNA mismatch repair endonuclease MutL [Thermomicrobiales bacterium]